MTISMNRTANSGQYQDRRGVWGIAFALTFIVSLIVAAALATGSLPLPDDPVEDVVRYTRDNRAVILLVAALQAASAIALWRFVPAVAAVGRRGGDGATRFAVVAGSVAAVSLLLSTFSTVIQVIVVSADSQTGIGLLRDITYYLGGVVHIVALAPFIQVHAIPAVRNRLSSRWLGIVGVMALVVCYLAILSPVVSVATVFLPIGRLLAFVWSVGLGMLMLRRSRDRLGSTDRAATQSEPDISTNNP